ncbi:MAG: hypothetical protein ACXW2Y_05335 [Acidimicrobiia bacterium]
MANDAVPLLIGVLHDHSLPDQEAGFERCARVGIAGAGDRLDRSVEFLHSHAAGLPRGASTTSGGSSPRRPPAPTTSPAPGSGKGSRELVEV